jgi:hypothetical protein
MKSRHAGSSYRVIRSALHAGDMMTAATARKRDDRSILRICLRHPRDSEVLCFARTFLVVPPLRTSLCRQPGTYRKKCSERKRFSYAAVATHSSRRALRYHRTQHWSWNRLSARRKFSSRWKRRRSIHPTLRSSVASTASDLFQCCENRGILNLTVFSILRCQLTADI